MVGKVAWACTHVLMPVSFAEKHGHGYTQHARVAEHPARRASGAAIERQIITVSRVVILRYSEGSASPDEWARSFGVLQDDRITPTDNNYLTLNKRAAEV